MDNYVILIICLSFLMFLILFLILSKTFKNYFSNTETSPEQEETELEETDQELEETDQELEEMDPDLIISSRRKRVLIISCYGYGNMGDNMYSEVFGFYLSECEVVKISDHTIFVDKEKQFFKKKQLTDYDFDYLIIGGGGLIISTKLKNSENMMHYINLAKAKGAPLYIISCGVQGPISNFTYDFSMWKPVFDQAKLITVRSKKDKELIDKLANPNKVFFFRDLGYIYPHIIDLHEDPIKTITLILAGPVNETNKDITKIVNERKKPVIIMNMGALKDDDNNRRMLPMDFPGFHVTKYYGAGKAPEFTKELSKFVNQAEMEKILTKDPELNDINPSDLTLKKVVSTIYNSELVLTGRYHGMIFSRSLGIPYDTLGMDTNKVLWEAPIDDIYKMISNSYNHIKLLRKDMGLQNNTKNDLINLEISIRSKT